MKKIIYRFYKYPALSAALALICGGFFAPAVAEVGVAPINPEFEAYQRQAKTARALSAATPAGRPLGYVPSPVLHAADAGKDVTAFLSAKRAALLSTSGTRALSRGSVSDATFDLRNESKLSPIRNQGIYGTCWTFGAYSSLESHLLPSESWDFSEDNMALNSGFFTASTDLMQQGGNNYMATAYLARWNGPVLEADDPYNGYTTSGLAVRKHVQEVLWLPGKTSSAYSTTYIANMKAALVSYGAVAASIDWKDSASISNGSLTDYYYFNSVCSIDSNSSRTCTGGLNGHMIAIVGWNDNMSASLFNNGSATPAGNGAWIARNSWGNTVGDNGYFYISYYDTSLGTEQSVYVSAESTTTYNYNYGYDKLGWVTSYGGDTTAWMAMQATATVAGERLSAVGFYTVEAGVSYQIYVYTGSTSGAPRSGTLAGSISGTMGMAGYHTVQLSSAVTLSSPGTRFSIVVQLANPNEYYPIAAARMISNYSDRATAAANQTFFSANGTSWTDFYNMSPTASAALKAFSKNPEADTTAPAAVTTMTAITGPGTNQVTLRWAAPGNNGSSGDITGGAFLIRYASHSDVSNGNNTLVTIATTTAAGAMQNYTLTITSSALTYWFALWTRDSAGNTSAVSNIPSAPVLRDTTAPAAVTDFTAQPTATEGRIRLTWTAPGDDGTSGTLTSGTFLIRYSSVAATINAGNGTALEISTSAVIPGSQQTVTLSGLHNGATYYLAMWTGDENGNMSPISNQTSAVVPDMPPAAPVTISTAPSGTGGITVSWSASTSTDVSFYRVYADTSAGAAWDDGFLAGTTSATSYIYYADAGISVLYFRVAAVDDGPNELQSPYSASITAYTNDTAAPVIASLTSPTHGTAGAWKSSSTVTFSWTVTDTDSGYRGAYVKFSSASSMTAAQLASAGTLVPALTTTTPLSDGLWYFHIAAVDYAGNLSPAQTVPLRIDANAPISTLAMTQTAGLTSGSQSVTLNVADGSGLAAAPTLSYYMVGGATKTVNISGSGGAYTGTFFIESYESSGTARFVYSATDLAGNTSAVLLGTTSFTVALAVSTGDITAQNSDGTAVFVPAGATGSSVTFKAETPAASLPVLVAANSKIPAGGGVEIISSANLAREFSALTSTGTTLTVFGTPVKISIPYPDANGDGIIDGTVYRAASLRMYYIDTASVWTEVPGSVVDTANRVVSAWTSHFSVYGLLSAEKVREDLAAVLVYPQPCYFKTTPRVTITQLPNTPDITVRIYTLDGTHVRAMTLGDGTITANGSNLKAEWDGRNGSGEKVASGMYLYLVKAQGETKVGRLGVFW